MLTQLHLYFESVANNKPIKGFGFIRIAVILISGSMTAILLAFSRGSQATSIFRRRSASAFPLFTVYALSTDYLGAACSSQTSTSVVTDRAPVSQIWLLGGPPFENAIDLAVMLTQLHLYLELITRNKLIRGFAFILIGVIGSSVSMTASSLAFFRESPATNIFRRRSASVLQHWLPRSRLPSVVTEEAPDSGDFLFRASLFSKCHWPGCHAYPICICALRQWLQKNDGLWLHFDWRRLNFKGQWLCRTQSQPGH